MRKGLLLTASTLLIMTGCSGFGNRPLGSADAGPSAARARTVGRIVTPNALARKLIAKMPRYAPGATLLIRHSGIPALTKRHSSTTSSVQQVKVAVNVLLFKTHDRGRNIRNDFSPPPQQSGIKSLTTV